MRHTMKTPLLILAAALSLPFVSARAQDAPPEFREKMEALEKAGDIASLHAELGKGQKMFGLLPSFKEKIARFEKASREEPWKLELRIEANLTLV